jgi:YHS domain-containing protein
MKSAHPLLALCTLAFGLASALPAYAADGHKAKDNSHAASSASAGKGQLVKLTEKDAAWAAKARAAYPLKVCVTSDEKLGAMGENAEFIYREKGKADRLVVFCCEGCEDDFKKEPAKYLSKIDAAAKKKTK